MRNLILSMLLMTSVLSIHADPVPKCNYSAEWIGSTADLICELPAGYTKSYEKDLSPSLRIQELWLPTQGDRPGQTKILLQRKAGAKATIVDALFGDFGATRLLFADGGDGYAGFCKYKDENVLHLVALVNASAPNPIRPEKAWMPDIKAEKFVAVPTSDVKCFIPRGMP